MNLTKDIASGIFGSAMKTRDIVTGLVVLVVIIAGVLLLRNARNKKLAGNPTPTPSITQKMNNTFPGLNIPQGSVKAELKDVTGGESYGVATETEIVANLPDLKAGQVYQAWLTNESGKKLLLGNLKLAKGGFILEYNSSKYQGYNKISITLGTKSILEGSF